MVTPRVELAHLGWTLAEIPALVLGPLCTSGLISNQITYSTVKCSSCHFCLMSSGDQTPKSLSETATVEMGHLGRNSVMPFLRKDAQSTVVLGVHTAEGDALVLSDFQTVAELPQK